MRKVFLFEIKKSLKNTKNIILWLVLLIVLMGYVVYNNNLNKHNITNEEFEARGNIWGNVMEVNGLLQKYSDDNRPEEIQQQIDFWREDQHFTSAVLVYSKWVGKDRWRDVLKTKIDQNKNLIYGIKKGYVQSDTKKELSIEKEHLKNEISYNKLLLKHDIKPMKSKYTMTGLNFLYRSFSDIMPIVVVILILLLGADVFTSESEMGSYKYLLLQPIKRKHIYFAKYFSSLANAMLMVFLTFGAVFVGTSTVNGFGQVNYPVAYDPSAYHRLLSKVNDTGALHYLSIGTFLAQAILLILLFVVFLVSMAMLVSSLAENSISSMSILIGIEGIIAMFLSYIKDIKIVSVLLPFTYNNSIEVLSGEFYGTALLGFIILATYSIILCILGCRIFSKRDIIC